ncbi:unnamed protein product [Amoebophrya sp. A120]|nr:unnamed protein product [Amoebophrya sp. A120]|eukprot:GSA120T00025342001.1
MQNHSCCFLWTQFKLPMSKLAGGKCCLFALLVNSALAVKVMSVVSPFGLREEASSPHAEQVASATINHANGGRDGPRLHRVRRHVDLRQFAEDAATHRSPQSPSPQSPTQTGRLDRNAQSRTTRPERLATYSCPQPPTHSRPQSPTHSRPQSPSRSIVLGSLPTYSMARDNNVDHFYIASSSRRNGNGDHVGSGATSLSALLPRSRTPYLLRSPSDMSDDRPASLSLLSPFRLPPSLWDEDESGSDYESNFLDGPGAGG